MRLGCIFVALWFSIIVLQEGFLSLAAQKTDGCTILGCSKAFIPGPVSPHACQAMAVLVWHSTHGTTCLWRKRLSRNYTRSRCEPLVVSGSMGTLYQGRWTDKEDQIKSWHELSYRVLIVVPYLNKMKCNMQQLFLCLIVCMHVIVDRLVPMCLCMGHIKSGKK